MFAYPKGLRGCCKAAGGNALWLVFLACVFYMGFGEVRVFIIKPPPKAAGSKESMEQVPPVSMPHLQKRFMRVLRSAFLAAVIKFCE